MMKPGVLRFAFGWRWLIPTLWGWVLFLAFFFGLVVPVNWVDILKLPYFWVLFVVLGFSFHGWLFIWNYKLIFGNTHLVVKTLWFPFFKPFSCDYEDIRWVMRGGGQYSVKIVLKNEQVLTLRPLYLEGGEAKIIGELKARIKPEKIMSEVEVLPSLWNNPKYTKHQRVVNIIFALVISFFGFYFNFFVLLANHPVAWKYIKDAGMLTRLNEYSVDADGSVWTIDWQMYNRPGFIIRHMVGNKVESWEFTNPTVDYLNMVAGDGQGNPWVFTYETTFHWVDEGWVEVPYPVDLEQIEIYLRWKIIDGKLWGFLEDENDNPTHLFEWNLATNESTVIDLPQYNDSTHSERLRLMPDGTLVLLRTYANLGVVELHQLVNQTWEKVLAYSAPENVIIENAYGMDATLDRSGQFWFLFPMASRDGYYMQRLKTQTNVWETTEIAYTEERAFNSYYRFEVDARGRAWVSSFDNIFVFLPEWGKSAELLVYYNDQNSGANGGQLLLATDGKMWAPHNPYWIDTNTDKLPRPLPDWLPFLGFKFTFFIAGLIGVALIQIIFYWIIYRRTQRENTAKILPET